jgi:hypothetical protein
MIAPGAGAVVDLRGIFVTIAGISTHPGEHHRRALILVVVAAALLTVAVRLPGAARDPLWYDETASAHAFTADSPLGVARAVWRTESTPAGWYMLAWATHQTGAAMASTSDQLEWLQSEKLPRILSVLFSAILTALVVLYAARRMPLWAAALAGLFVALGYQLVEHGQELRAYALLGLVSMLFVLALEAAVERPTRRRLLLLALVVALGAVTHYFFLFAVAVGVAWVWFRRPGPARPSVTLSIAVGLAPFVLMLPVFVHQTVAQADQRRWIGHFSVETVANVYGFLFASGRAWSYTDGRGALIVLPLVLVGAIVLARRPDGELGALMATVPVAVPAVLWAFGAAVFNARNLILTAPFAAVAAAAAVAAIPRRPVAIAAGVALAVAMTAGFAVAQTLGRTPNDKIAEALVDMGWTPDSPIVFFGTLSQQVNVAWYLPGHFRLISGKPTGTPCPHVFVVSENAAGQEFLRIHRLQMTSRKTFPWYGATPRGPRRSRSVVVAELAWSDGLLPAAPSPLARAVRRSAHRPPPCLSPGGSAGR